MLTAPLPTAFAILAEDLCGHISWPRPHRTNIPTGQCLEAKTERTDYEPKYSFTRTSNVIQN